MGIYCVQIHPQQPWTCLERPKSYESMIWASTVALHCSRVGDNEHLVELLLKDAELDQAAYMGG